MFTVPEAADHLRVSESYLDKLRVYGGGPTFVRLGPRKIVYRESDLDAWILQPALSVHKRLRQRAGGMSVAQAMEKNVQYCQVLSIDIYFDWDT